MSIKRIIILGRGFDGAKCAETLRDELPLDHTGNVGVEIERSWTR